MDEPAKLTMAQINNGFEALSELMRAPKKAKVAAQLMRYYKRVQQEAKLIDEYRNELITRHGEKDDEGTLRIQPNTESMTKFMSEFAEYLNGESSIEPMDITIDKLISEGLSDDAEVSGATLLNAECFFK